MKKGLPFNIDMGSAKGLLLCTVFAYSRAHAHSKAHPTVLESLVFNPYYFISLNKGSPLTFDIASAKGPWALEGMKMVLPYLSTQEPMIIQKYIVQF